MRDDEIVDREEEREHCVLLGRAMSGGVREKRREDERIDGEED